MTSPGSPSPLPALKELRDQIDAVDERLLALLNERARIAERVGEVKRAASPDAPFHVPAREREVIARLQARNAGPFPTEAIRSVFQEIMSACLSLERPLRVAYPGPEGTTSHQAARFQFGLSAQGLPQRTIQAVFHAVAAGQADYGVVPVESATEGVVDPTLDAFLDSPVRVVAEILVPVELALLAHPDLEFGQVSRVYGTADALEQSGAWRSAHLARAAPVTAPSAAEAARLAREDPEGAAVAPDLMARLHDLRVTAEGIQGVGGDATRFWVLGHKPCAPTGRDRTSLLVTVKDSPGILLRVLEPLARREINLTRIESRPTRQRAWEYAFFLDLEGHEADPAVAGALAELEALSAGVKRLGSYPRAEERRPG